MLPKQRSVSPHEGVSTTPRYPKICTGNESIATVNPGSMAVVLQLLEGMVSCGTLGSWHVPACGSSVSRGGGRGS